MDEAQKKKAEEDAAKAEQERIDKLKARAGVSVAARVRGIGSHSGCFAEPDQYSMNTAVWYKGIERERGR